ncbi:MAG: alginate export family protein [Sphingobium sp.]|nr:alginate export family protein [Sphingobium sp.]
MSPVLRSIALMTLSLCAIPAKADDLKISGSVRLRYEAIDGQARTGFDSQDALVNLRTQILADYGSGPLHVVAEIFDSRAWGADRGTPLTTGEVNTFEPVQAYLAADLGPVLGKRTKASIMVGRMTLNLGSRRLVAADDYRNTTNGYTGIRADLAAPGAVKATFIYMLPQLRLPDDPASLRSHKVELDKESFDTVLWGGVASKGGAIGPATVELSFFHLGERDAPGRPSRDRSLNTFGGRIFADPKAGKIDYEIEGYYQTGQISVSTAATAARQNVSASFARAKIGYTFAAPWQPHLSLEYDRASGDKPGGSYGRFDTLYGMRRADLAPAGLYNAIGRANISTLATRIEVVPGKRLDAFAAYRAMWLASATDAFSTTGVRDASGASGDFAGHQIEGRLRYWLIPNRLRYEIDGLLLAKGRFLREAPNAPAGKWTRYVSMNLTAAF